jgi:hypothetical protein
MTKRRSTWLGASGALFLILSLSGVAAGATPPDAVPDVVVDTTATFEDIDGNGIDDDCQDVAAVLDEDAAAAELLTVDTDGDGVISTTEAAHSPRIGGTNCNHGGYVSWIAHQDVTCVDETTEPVTEPVVELIVAEDEDQDEDTDEEVAEPETDACAADAEAAKAEKAAAAALRAALKADRTLARETAKAERTAARETAKAERTAARDAAKAERAAARAAAKAERAAAKAARQGN